MADDGVLDGRSSEWERCGANFFAVAPWKPFLRLGANWRERVGVYVFGFVAQRHTGQADGHFASRVVFRNSSFIRDGAAVVYEQTAGRTTGELAAYRRSAPAAVVGIPAADLRPASFWATWHATKWPGATSRKGAISTLQMSIAAGQRG